MKKISGKLFPAVFLIGVTAVIVIGAVYPIQAAAISAETGTKTVGVADVTPKENYVPVAESGSDSVSVVGDAKVTITTASLPVGGVSVAYSQKVQATGGVAPYIWSISVGSLPSGLSLDASTGEITGMPTTYGTSKFTVRVTDSQNPVVTVNKVLSVTINPPTLIILTKSFPDGVVRTAYSQKVQATGGFVPYAWSISAGSLPAGLSLNKNSGVIIGTPTTAGTSTFTVQVTDRQNPAAVVTKVFSVKIESCILPPMKIQ